MENVEFNSEYVSKITNEAINDSITSLMTQTEQMIVNAAKKGKAEITLYSDAAYSSNDLSKLASSLKDKGFKTSYIDDQREGTFLVIKW